MLAADKHRRETELAQVLSGQVGDRDRARKDFVDATRARVHSAAVRHAQERKKKETLERAAAAAPPPPPPAGGLEGGEGSSSSAQPDVAGGGSGSGSGSGDGSMMLASLGPGMLPTDRPIGLVASAPSASVAGGGAGAGVGSRSSGGGGVLGGSGGGGGAGAAIGLGGPIPSTLGEIYDVIEELARRRRALVQVRKTPKCAWMPAPHPHYPARLVPFAHTVLLLPSLLHPLHTQAGFEDEASELTKAVGRLKDAAEAKRREEEAKLYKQKLWALQLSQKNEQHQLQEEQVCTLPSSSPAFRLVDDLSFSLSLLVHATL